jgi:hypothetical protein
VKKKRESEGLMKIKPEHVQAITEFISNIVLKHPKEIEEHAKKVSPMRLRWDVFNRAVPFYSTIRKEIYEYANDEHIDTLLRKIFGHKKK